MSITDKVALVTGASRGIGASIADTLGQAGAMVIGTATSDSGADAITQRFQSLGIRGVGRRLDVKSGEDVDAMIKAITDEFGAPQILVNNAGITRDNLLMRMKDEEWEDVLETNLSSVFRVSRACQRGMMKARWGRIITITSVVGSMGNAGQTNYAATKAGAEGFSRALAKEIGGRGVTVNTVAPGFIDTDMTRELDEAHKQMLLSVVPMQRFGLPSEIAQVVLFLAGDGAAYITGETIHVNGGMYMG